MKTGWTIKKLGEVCERKIARLKTLAVDTIKYIDISSIDRLTKRIVSSTEYEVKDAPGRAQQVVLPDDLLVSTVRPNLNAVALVPYDVDGALIASTGFSVLRAGDMVCARWLYYFCQTSDFIDPLVADSEKAAYPSVTDARVREVEIPVPPLAEQKRIVAKIDAAFEKIDKLKANAERNLANAKELFQSALNEAMRPKPGWVEKRLGEIGFVQTGSTPSTRDSSNFGSFIPFVKPGDITTFYPIAYRNEGLSEKGLLQTRFIPKGSVLMVCIGASIGKVACTNRDCATNQQINALSPSNGYDGEFVALALTTTEFQNSLKDCAGQATLPIVSKSKWESLRVCVPSLNEQRSIVSRLTLILSRIRGLQANYTRLIADCAEMRQAVLKEAFEGRL